MKFPITDGPLAFVQGHEGLRRLALLLDDQEKWEQRLRWDFKTVLSNPNTCETSGCAMGLAAVAWPDQFGRSFGAGATDVFVQKAFGISTWVVESIFWGAAYEEHEGLVTPGLMAAEIRAYLADPAGYEEKLYPQPE
jgi:hypothetical protein